MPAKTRQAQAKCQVCRIGEAKYRCPACPTRYCSVPCFKAHKANVCGSAPGSSTAAAVVDIPPPAPEQPTEPAATDIEPISHDDTPIASSSSPPPLRPLTDILWPPEPDSSIFTDPLKKEDPKPLRREELMRIATSPQLRHLLSTPTLSQILRILDALPTPTLRSSNLARLLSIDPQSLSKPLPQSSLLSQRDSPPPLEDLLQAFVGNKDERASGGGGGWGAGEGEGWWLGSEGGQGGRVWIGEEERRLMRIWAGVVCRSIEGDDGGGEVGWGQGELGWEL